MTGPEVSDPSCKIGIRPSLKAMLDYFGDRVESVEIVRKRGDLQLEHKSTIRLSR